MADTKEIRRYLNKEIESVLDLASELEFDSKHALHQHVISLYGSIVELSSSVKELYDAGHYSTIPVVLRTILEAFVDLCNLCKDPKYGYSLTINSALESIKFLRVAKDDENAYTRMIAGDPNIDVHISDFEKQIVSLKAKGNESVKIKGKFEKAGMLDEYLTIYNMLCAATHNDIRALRARHIVIEKDSFSLEIFKQEDTETMRELLGITSELLLRATFEVHALLGSKKDEELQSLRDDLNKIRGDA